MERWSELNDVEAVRGLTGLPFEEALRAARIYIAEVADTLSSEVIELLPAFDRVTELQVSLATVDQLDTLCFDLEGAGNLAASSHAFAAARFASACEYLGRAVTHEDVMNAVYEAWHSLMPNEDRAAD